jgi:hypothetical protein
MPCPPSYEELRFMQLDQDTAGSSASLARHIAETRATITLMTQIEGLAKDDKALENLKAMVRQLEELVKTASETSLSFVYPDTWPEMEDVHRYEAFAANLQRADQALEFRLCETRTFLYSQQHALIHPNLADHPALAEAWPIEVERHRLHREADREAAIAPLEQDRKHYEDRLQMELSPTQRESAQAYFEERTQKIHDIKAIPIEVLMANRDLF